MKKCSIHEGLIFTSLEWILAVKRKRIIYRDTLYVHHQFPNFNKFSVRYFPLLDTFTIFNTNNFLFRYQFIFDIVRKTRRNVFGRTERRNIVLLIREMKSDWKIKEPKREKLFNQKRNWKNSIASELLPPRISKNYPQTWKLSHRARMVFWYNVA